MSMRIKLNFTPTNQNVPYNTQHYVISFINKCLGENHEHHDGVADYCISTIQNGKRNKILNKLEFKNGCSFIFSTTNPVLLERVITFLIDNPNKELCYGMKYDSYDFISDDLSDGWNHIGFFSGIYLKSSVDGKDIIHTLEDDDFEEKLNEITINKIKKINPDLNLKHFKIKLRKQKNKRGVKAIDIKPKIMRNGIEKRIFLKANQCNLEIHTNKKVLDVLYGVGIGSSTKLGFGAFFNLNKRTNYRK